MTLRMALIASIATLALGAPAWAASNWPQWRGPHGNGIADAHDLPVTWTETENVKWKSPLPAWSGSTPVVWGDSIFLTTASKGADASAPLPPQEGPQMRGQARKPLDPGGDSILLIRLDRTTGQKIWEKEFDRGNKLERKTNRAAPSPVTDGGHVWVQSSNAVVACFDFEGNKVWDRDLQLDYGNFTMAFGFNGSPLLWEDRLVFAVMHSSGPFMLALDKKTNKELWKTPRPTDAHGESPDSYTSPQLLAHEGRALVVVNGGDVVTAHDLKTGEEVWRASGLNPQNSPDNRIIPSCVVAGDLVVVPTRKEPLIAVRAGGKGDVTATHTAWTRDGWGPDVPTPASDGKSLWMVKDQGGIFSCLEAATGKAIYDDMRVENALGTYSASPIVADGKVYAVNEEGATVVLDAGPQFKTLAVNRVDPSYTLSTPVIVDNQILLKTGAALYCIEKGATGAKASASGQKAPEEAVASAGETSSAGTRPQATPAE